MNARVEICVVGGGPAGSTLAARLAGLGHDVALVEQRPFPRPHIGESLSPAIWPLVRAVGLAAADVRSCGVPVSDAAVRWRAAEEQVPIRDGVTVDRGAFDAMLLDRARAAGAHLLPPTRAGRPVREPDGWRIPLPDGDLHAAVVADASGRRRLLGGPRTRTSPATVAVHGRWPLAWPAGVPGMLVDTVAEGWLWAAQLPGGHARVMALVDPGSLRAADGRPARLLARLLRTSPLLSQVLPGPPGDARVESCDAGAYATTEPIGTDFVRVGEAAIAIDPLSSAGVQTAIRSGLAAAAAVHTLRLPAGDTAAALEFYTAAQAHDVARHDRAAARFYAEQRTFAGEPFWQRRRDGAVLEPRPPATSLAGLWHRRVRLRPPAELRETPCLVGDVVERRPALHSPGLGRPVAFLGGVELAPLLRQVQAAPSLAAGACWWDRELPPGHGSAVVAWLHRHALLEPVP